MVGVLQVRCDRCKVSAQCPRNGSSPLVLSGGKRTVLCQIVAGYGRDPVDESSLSPESLAAARKNGPCVTFAEVPTRDPHTGHVYFETTKVFHQPILHPREKTDYQPDIMLKNGGGMPQGHR